MSVLIRRDCNATRPHQEIVTRTSDFRADNYYQHGHVGHLRWPQTTMTWRLAGVLGLILTLFTWVLLQRPAAVAQAPLLPMNFAHLDHTEHNCILCHHNYIDDTGRETCIACHKERPEVASLIETQFHTLCRDCHVSLQRRSEASGPIRACVSCHTGDDLP